MEHLTTPAFVLDVQGRVLIWNRACERLTGCQAGELIGRGDHWKAFYDRERPCLADLVIANSSGEAEALGRASAGPEVNPHRLSVETWRVMPRTGQRLYLAIDAGPIFDERGQLTAAVETLRDLTANKLMEVELSTLADYDALTSIANRRTFDRRLVEEWSRAGRSQTPLSLLLIDLDRFKQCNDNLGHAAGDRCLQDVAQSIRSEARRRDDLAARIGGDEFAALLPNTPIEAAVAIAERIRRAVECACLPAGKPPSRAQVTISVGVAASRGFSSCEAFFAAADAALYGAKRLGRNWTVVDGDRRAERAPPRCA